MNGLSEELRRCARLKFVRHIYFMQHIEVYFVPSIGGIITRSVAAKRAFQLPQGSIWIGVYRFPVAEGAPPPRFNDPAHRKVAADLADAFMGDLDDVLAKQRVASAGAAIARI